ncbi:MAG: hypothetical protein WC043_10395 [Pseudobdellovibrionaceae bacterium]
MSIPFAAAAEGYSGNLAKLEMLAETLSEERPVGAAGDYDVRMQAAAEEFCDHLECVPLTDAAGHLHKAFFNAPYDQQQQILTTAHGIAQKMGQKDIGEVLAGNLALARILDESKEPEHKEAAAEIQKTVFSAFATMSLTPYLKAMDSLSQYIPDEPTNPSLFSDSQVDLLRSDFEKRLAKCLGDSRAELRHVNAFGALAFKLTHDEYYDAARQAITAKVDEIDLASRQGKLGLKNP